MGRRQCLRINVLLNTVQCNPRLPHRPPCGHGPGPAALRKMSELLSEACRGRELVETSWLLRGRPDGSVDEREGDDEHERHRPEEVHLEKALSKEQR